MTKEIIEQIFNLGADACYHTIDQNTGNCDKEAFAKLKQDAVKLFCQPAVISSFACLSYDKDCDKQCDACKFVENGLKQVNDC